MQRILRYATGFACAAQLVFVGILLPETYGHHVVQLLLLAVLPVLAAISLYCGPDIEESLLLRKVRKARLETELQLLTEAKNAKKN